MLTTDDIRILEHQQHRWSAVMATSHINVAPPFHCHLEEANHPDCSVWNTEQSSAYLMGTTTPNGFYTAGDTIKITEVSLLFSSVISASPTGEDYI
ncbi:MAG: hypothetical protein K2K98_02880 [Muribaculaceae bacterium]|nr:hypothetical protein [Muribaculaceae bacterium]